MDKYIFTQAVFYNCDDLDRWAFDIKCLPVVTSHTVAFPVGVGNKSVHNIWKFIFSHCISSIQYLFHIMFHLFSLTIIKITTVKNLFSFQFLSSVYTTLILQKLIYSNGLLFHRQNAIAYMQLYIDMIATAQHEQ